jgi:hypothetical protein
VARFVSELFEKELSGPFRGTLRLQTATPFALLGLRFSGIQFSTLPAGAIATAGGVPARVLQAGSNASVPLSGTIGGAAALIVPQFAMSGGWATQLALVNNTTATMTGRLDIFDTSGNPMSITLNGNPKSTFTYSIDAGGTFVLAPRDSNGQSPF